MTEIETVTDNLCRPSPLVKMVTTSPLPYSQIETLETPLPQGHEPHLPIHPIPHMTAIRLKILYSLKRDTHR